MLEEALQAVKQYRKDINLGIAEESNKWVSDDFAGFFGFFDSRDYEVYTAATYRASSSEAYAYYEGKEPRWEYEDLTHAMRSANELVLTAILNFSEHDKLIASALVIEVFKKEGNSWKLYRQHMEKYKNTR